MGVCYSQSVYNLPYNACYMENYTAPDLHAINTDSVCSGYCCSLFVIFSADVFNVCCIQMLKSISSMIGLAREAK